MKIIPLAKNHVSLICDDGTVYDIMEVKSDLIISINATCILDSKNEHTYQIRIMPKER